VLVRNSCFLLVFSYANRKQLLLIFQSNAGRKQLLWFIQSNAGRKQLLWFLSVLRIRIRPDPYDFAGSGSVWAIPDLDPDPSVVLLFEILLLVVLLLVALLGTGDDSFNPLRTWYRGVSYDRDRYPDFSGPSWVTWTYFYFLRLGSGSGTGSGSKKFEGSDPDPEKVIRIRNTVLLVPVFSHTGGRKLLWFLLVFAYTDRKQLLCVVSVSYANRKQLHGFFFCFLMLVGNSCSDFHYYFLMLVGNSCSDFH